MSLTSTLTDDVFVVFLKCRYKAYMKLKSTAGVPSEYQQCSPNGRRVPTRRPA